MRLLVMIIAMLVAEPAFSASARVSDPVDHARDLLRRLQSKEKDQAAFAELDSTDAALRDYLQGSPPDTSATIVLLHLYELRRYAGAMGMVWSGEAGALEEAEPYLTIVNRTLQVDSLNAEIRYWRGRLYSVRKLPVGMDLGPNPRLAEAIRELRRAVEINSKEERYRASLAYLVLANGDLAEARAIYKGLMKGKHPMYVLLRDWERMPVIQGAVVIGEGAAVIPEEASSLLAFGGARTRYLVYPGTAAEFETRCKAQWPSFHLTAMDTLKSDAHWIRLAQDLVWKGDTLVPRPTSDKWGIGYGGVRIQVDEQRAKAEDPAWKHPGVSAGATYCSITYFNQRGWDDGF